MDGVPGRNGVDGIPGTDGKSGLDGIPGKPGDNGKDGEHHSCVQDGDVCHHRPSSICDVYPTSESLLILYKNEVESGEGFFCNAVT